MYSMPVSPKELSAIVISRFVRNGEGASLAANLPVCSAGLFLAQLTHAPDLRLISLSNTYSLVNATRIEELTQIASPIMMKYCESITSLEESLYLLPRLQHNFFGALQIDRYGNSNLIGTGTNHRALKFRGPGPVGTTTNGTLEASYHIYVNDHSRRTFVERCCFRSALGWGDGGANARSKLGISGGGPQYVITPKSVMDFEEDSKRMRLKYTMPGVGVDEIIANTGFELVIPDLLEELSEPSGEELITLRTRVDPKGLLRK